MSDSVLSSFIISFILLLMMCILAYYIPSIDIIIDIAAGVCGVPLVYLFPSLACLKKNMHKTAIKQLMLKIWIGLCVIFMAINLVKTG